MRMLTILIAIAALSLGGCRSTTAPHLADEGIVLDAAPRAAAAAAAPGSGRFPPGIARYEIAFLKHMIDHHAMAVEMASLCEGRASHAELLALCAEIEAAQAGEIERMQAWLEDWYGITHEPEHTHEGHAMIERLSALSGAKFEIAFLDGMIRHHADGVARARVALHRVKHRELAELAEHIMTTQSAEIRVMRDWLCDWYSRCGTAEHRR